VDNKSNLTENCNYLIGIFNPYNYANIQMHFDYVLKDWKGKYRSLHILAARDTEAPKDLFLVCDGANSVFRELPIDPIKIKEALESFKQYELI